MSFDLPASPRRPMHRRAIEVQVFAREDGLYEAEARLQDTKTRDLVVGGRPRAAGESLHEMVLTLVIDAGLNIRAVRSETLAAPYPGQCEQHGDAYQRLVGLNLMQGFRAEVKARLGGVLGCTHITELCSVLPTAVLQGFAGVVLDTNEGAGSGQRPFQIDRCHALRSGGPVVQTFYPRWYRTAASPVVRELATSSS